MCSTGVLCAATTEKGREMKTRTFQRLVTYLCISLVLLAFLIRVFGITLWQSPESATRIDLSCLSAAISILLRDRNDLFVQMMQDKPSSDITKEMLETILTKEGMKNIWDHISDGDGWGRAYNVAWSTDRDVSKSPLRLRNRNPLQVWSSGKNGVNELGGGDDLSDNHDWSIFPTLPRNNR